MRRNIKKKLLEIFALPINSIIFYLSISRYRTSAVHAHILLFSKPYVFARSSHTYE